MIPASALREIRDLSHRGGKGKKKSKKWSEENLKGGRGCQTEGINFDQMTEAKN